MSETDKDEVFSSLVKDVESTGVSVLCLCGELDASTVPGFLADARDVIKRRRNVIVDVHLLDYVDSTGVAAMLSTRNALVSEGRKMCLVGCHGLLSKVLQITQAETELPCLDNLDTAIERLIREEDALPTPSPYEGEAE